MSNYQFHYSSLDELPKSLGKKTHGKREQDQEEIELIKKQIEEEIQSMDLQSTNNGPSNQNMDLNNIDVVNRDDFGNENMIEEEEDEIDESDITMDQYKLPLKYSLPLFSHLKRITAIAWEKSGVRLASGSLDTLIKLWDFNGMSSDPVPFREVENIDPHAITSMSYSPTGEYFAVSFHTPKPKIITREGKTIMSFVLGDVYKLNQSTTTGHTARVTSIQWHPKETQTILSGSQDGTIRIWDLNWNKSFDELQSKTIIITKNERNKKCVSSTLAYNKLGTKFASGMEDGSINIWQSNGKLSRPEIRINKGHSNVISHVQYSDDEYKLASRGMDHTLKIWDTRNIKSPLKEYINLNNEYECTQLCYNSDGSLLATVTSDGKICVFDAIGLMDDPIYTIDSPNNVGLTSCIWHPTLNQIIVGGNEGKIFVYYHPKYSIKGAVLCANKLAKQKQADFYSYNLHAGIAPNALKLFAEDPKPWSYEYKDYFLEEKKKLKPQFDNNAPKVPSVIPLFKDLYMKDHPEKRNVRNVDPREALLEFAQKRPGDTVSYIDHLYSTTQPKKLLTDKTLEQEQEDVRDEYRNRLSKL